MSYVDCRVRLIHGTEDEKIDFKSVERLEKRCLEAHGFGLEAYIREPLKIEDGPITRVHVQAEFAHENCRVEEQEMSRPLCMFVFPVALLLLAPDIQLVSADEVKVFLLF